MMFRKSRFVTAICLLLLLLIFAGLVSSTNCFIQRYVYFDKPSYKAGESGVFSVTIEGEHQTLYFTRLEIFFDWGNYWTSGVTIIDPTETKTISVTFSVPSSVSAGSHSYYYKLTWSLSISLENPVTHTSSSNIITIKEPPSEGFVFQWEFMVLMAVIGIMIGVFATFIIMKSKEQKKTNSGNKD